eukprot:2385401-Rhodomonas_salina.1
MSTDLPFTTTVQSNLYDGVLEPVPKLPNPAAPGRRDTIHASPCAIHASFFGGRFWRQFDC